MKTKEYAEFLQAKSVMPQFAGIDPSDPHSMLFDFQADIVKWALRRGRACIWADCGLGKTFMQIEWARQIPGNVLILAPLAVSMQTVSEAAKLGCKVNYCRSQEAVTDGITITNYEMMDKFDPEFFAGVVCDESSILKNFEGKFRNAIIENFSRTPFRLACTATPAPNDYMELGNHAEFVGAMTRTEMLSMFFVHDGGDTSQWRLKGHAQDDFWKWVCSWAVMIRKPSDLGYEDGDFCLPPCETIETASAVTAKGTNGYLFALPASTLQERLAARRDTVAERVQRCVDLIGDGVSPWVIWCNLNSEQDELAASLGDRAFSIYGSLSLDEKESRLARWLAGERPILISKPSIVGLGINMQHCANVAFVGLSDSWEQYYQAVRRCWRFGQKRKVTVHIIISELEGAVAANIARKEFEAGMMAEGIVKHMHSINEQNLRGTEMNKCDYKRDIATGDNWTLHLGDCVEVAKEIPSDSIGYSIFSPPFASLYTYSASDRDMGNSKNYDEFGEHFSFLVKELYRVMMPGRHVSFHCMNLPTSKSHHGYIGINDFRGDLIRLFQAEGFIFHSEVVIWKDPVTQMQRTKALGLLWKQIKKDSSMSRQGLADYLVTMRKPGENPVPIQHTADEFPVDQWQRWASPVWMDINPSETLQFRSAREHNDERHICPLQLEVIRRGVVLWSTHGDTVFSPFAGIGSEGYVALQNGRKFLGAELKESYWKQANANLKSVESQNELFAA